MDDERREHALTITVNGRTFTRVIVDPHYEKKHPDINDQTVLALLRLLDDSETEAVVEKDGFTYLARELSWQGKLYRLVLTYCDEDFLGVVNAFRVKERKS